MDASVGTKWLLPEKDTDWALAVLRGADTGRYTLHVPDTWRAECANAVWKGQHLRGLYTTADAQDALEGLGALDVRAAPTAPLLLRAYAVAVAHGCSVYDALYITLAERLEAPLATADQRLERVARECGVEVAAHGLKPGLGKGKP